MKRRGFLKGLGAFSLASCAPAVITNDKPKFAITMDDFSLGFNQLLSPKKRNARILEALDKHNHKAVGFVTGRFVDNELGREVIESWSDAGHMIGNHTYSHMNSSEADVAAVKVDILKNHTFLSGYENYQKVFRFPFLAEGGTVEKVANYRAFLKEHEFQNAAVTIDTIDWYTTSRFEKKLNENPSISTKPYRDYYIKSVLELATHFQCLAEALGYNNLPHSMLMHHNILNGLFLDDVLSAMKSAGWELVDAEDTLKHPLYSLEPNTPTRGRSVLSVLALEKGLDTSSFPEAYRGFGEKTMDALGL